MRHAGSTVLAKARLLPWTALLLIPQVQELYLVHSDFGTFGNFFKSELSVVGRSCESHLKNKTILLSKSGQRLFLEIFFWSKVESCSVGMVVYAFNHNTQKAEVCRSL